MQPCITSIDQAVPFKSKNVPWVGDQGQNDFPVDFIDPAVKGMDNPYVEDFLIRVDGSYTTVASTGSARGMLLAQMLDRIQIKDSDGLRVDIRGSSLRIQLQQEDGTGLGYEDQSNAGAGAAVDFVFYLRIPTCSPRTARAENKRDFRWDARKLRNGGQITIDFGPTVIGPSSNYQLTVTGNPSVEIYLNIVDEHRKRDPSRMILREWVIYTSDQTFPLGADNGTKTVKLRSALQYIGQVGESKASPDTWDTQSISSRVLQYFNIKADALVYTDLFSRRDIRFPDPAGVTASVDGALEGFVIPLFVPQQRQQITEMADCGSFDWRTTLTFGSGTFTAANQPKMIFTYVEDNPSTEACGPNATSGSTALSDAGKVPPTVINPKLAAKLPRVYGTKGSGLNKQSSR